MNITKKGKVSLGTSYIRIFISNPNVLYLYLGIVLLRYIYEIVLFFKFLCNDYVL